MSDEALALQTQEERNPRIDELLDFIDAEEVKDLGISDEDTFAIKSREQADYLAGQYNKLQHEIDDVNDAANTLLEKYKEKIERWREAEMRKRESPMNWLAMRLRTYAEQQLKDSKKKSVSLPNGVLKFGKHVEMVYDDDLLLKNLQKIAPKFLKEVPKKINKADLKKACEEKNGDYYLDGVKLEGMSIVTHPDTFRIM